jgi:hypothetical protein
MTEVATPAPATETEQRACPHCGSPLAPDQEWCLNCGNAVGTRIAPTPRWRVPVFLVGTVVALFVAALVLALVELSGDPQPVAKAPAQATATPSAAPDEGAPAATTAPQPSATPTATPGQVAPDDGGEAAPTPTPGNPPATGGVAQWPSGKTAWTVIVASTKSRAEADKKAAAAGPGAGVLHSDDFSSLRKGYWVVFASQYPDQKSAQAAATSRGGDAYARRVVPR